MLNFGSVANTGKSWFLALSDTLATGRWWFLKDVLGLTCLVPRLFGEKGFPGLMKKYFVNEEREKPPKIGGVTVYLVYLTIDHWKNPTIVGVMTNLIIDATPPVPEINHQLA